LKLDTKYPDERFFTLSPYFCPKYGLSLVEKGAGDAPNFAQKSAHRFLA
jgi:hypothetical protein